MAKTALITGGVHRLGGHISLHLARLGFDLAIIYNSSSDKQVSELREKLSKFNIKYKFYQCDIKDLKALKDTSDNIGKDFARINILINNAGIIKNISFKELTEDIYKEVMDTNLRPAVFLSQYSLPYLLGSEDPLIINIASLGGIQHWPGFFPYSLSKAALIKATYLMAKEMAPDIRVNAIAPGLIEIKEEKGKVDDKLSKDKIPLRRNGTPEDIVNAIDFIINCKYLTGQIIPVDGGSLLR